MRKSQIAKLVSKRLGIKSKAKAEAYIDAVLTEIRLAVINGRTVELRGFGTFYPKFQKARRGVNIKAGESMQIPERYVPDFKPGTIFKEDVIRNLYREDGRIEVTGIIT